MIKPTAAAVAKLARETDRSRSIGQVVRPAGGWLRTLRKALGLRLTELARRLKITPPAVRSFEQAEVDDRITLASLRRTAAAMNCDLVYVLVPRTGTLVMLAASESAKTKSSRGPADPPLIYATVPDDADKKVTDKTWRTLYGDD